MGSFAKKELVVDIINKQRDIMINCLMTTEEIKDIYHSINQGVIESGKAKRNDRGQLEASYFYRKKIH